MNKKWLFGILVLIVLLVATLVALDDEAKYPMPKYCLLDCSDT